MRLYGRGECPSISRVVLDSVPLSRTTSNATRQSCSPAIVTLPVAKGWLRLMSVHVRMCHSLTLPVSPLIIAAAAILAIKIAADPMRTTNVARIAGEPPPTSRMVAQSLPVAWGRSHATLGCPVLAKVRSRARIHVGITQNRPHQRVEAAIFT